MSRNKFLLPVLVAALVIIADQWVKLYIKTHFFLGEEINVVGNWFKLHFTENYGMAFGLEFGGKSGKILLTVFRILAVAGIGWYVAGLVKKNAHPGYLIACALIFAGALGNIIDSVVYGVMFGESTPFEKAMAFPPNGGYAPLFYGRVVDMFYFPVIRTTIPQWFPIWKGEFFEFFRPVFNVADAAISIGFFSILLFNKTFFAHERKEKTTVIVSEQNDPAA